MFRSGLVCIVVMCCSLVSQLSLADGPHGPSCADVPRLEELLRHLKETCTAPVSLCHARGYAGQSASEAISMCHSGTGGSNAYCSQDLTCDGEGNRQLWISRGYRGASADAALAICQQGTGGSRAYCSQDLTSNDPSVHVCHSRGYGGGDVTSAISNCQQGTGGSQAYCSQDVSC